MDNVRTIFQLGREDGEVGIELEMEGRNLPTEAPKGWRSEPDGSLRDGIEYVLTRPVPRKEVLRTLDRMTRLYARDAVEADPSIRTSTHVHINVQEMNMKEVYNFICLYLLFEDALVKWCGESREGNLFCLRAQDAESMLDTLEQVAYTKDWHSLHSDRLRYAALNVSSLGKYGSLEFRSLRGTTDMAVVSQWVQALLKLKDAALTFNNPTEIITGFSEGGEGWLAEEVFQEQAEGFFNYIGWEKDIYQGVRRCQSIAFACDWNNI